MARMIWDAPGDRIYEGGLDRGVLHVHGHDVVAWPGLTAVNETPKGGDIRAIYQDGFRVHNYTAIREFEAGLDAISYPDEFASCDGVGVDSAAPGLYVDQQAPTMFDFAYRTGVGSALSNGLVNYKLHLVYNCLVSPSTKNYKTRSDSTDISTHSWTVVTVPRRDILTKAPSAHFIIDSTKAEASMLKEIEDILYGTASTKPRFLDPLEVRTILSGE